MTLYSFELLAKSLAEKMLNGPGPDTETEAWSLEEAAHNAVYPVPTLITGQEQLCWFEKFSVI